MSDRWHTRYPHLGTEPLSPEVFTSREHFELEREHIFKKVWLNIGRVEQIPEVGNYFVQDIAMCQTSILVVRGNDGEIRAFHNMCTHRGNKIAWDQSGSCKVFTCKFHGWAFALNGALQHVPDEEDFFDLKREEAGLTPVACDVWEGFVFINVDPNPEESLEEYLGDLARDFSGFPFAEMTASAGVWTTEIDANWKLAKDSFSETYHIKFLHKRQGGGRTNDANPFSHFLDVQLFPRHGRGEVAGYPRQSTSTSSVLELAAQHTVLPSFSTDGSPPGVNHGGFEEWSTELHNIFPSFVVIAWKERIVTHNFWPIDVDRTLWQMIQYFPKAQTVEQRFGQECGHTRVRDVAMEDGSTLEQAQSVLASGARKGLFLKDEEVFIRHRHDVIHRMIKGQPLYNPAAREEDSRV